jgi:aldehyde:ferredoxin oxidoreductase
VYIRIYNDDVQILDAGKFWGKSMQEADTMIRQEFGSTEIETAGIGQAGENLVTFASIMLSRERAAGRAGGGCVMGSKNLKAIAVRGTKGIKIAHPESFFKVTEDAYRRMDGSFYWQAFAKDGTPVLVRPYYMVGGLPWKNHQWNTVPEDVVGKLDSKFLLENFKTTDAACSAGCACACSTWWKIKGDESPAAARYAGEKGEKPELVTICSTIAWGNEDMAVACHFQNLWNRYGMDVVEMGQCIGFLMELYQRGIVTEKDMQDWTGEALSLNWGDYELAEKITESVALKKNALFDILGGGVYKAAKKIEKLKGVSVVKYCQYGGKKAAFTEDQRSRATWTTLMATSTRGADHLKALSVIEQGRLVDVANEYLGGPEAAEMGIPPTKGVVAAWEEDRTTIMNCMGLCIFNSGTFSYTGPSLDFVSRAYTAVTGLEPEDLFATGERVYNIEKAFNSRLGLTRKDDSLCERWEKTLIPEGCPGEGTNAGLYLDQMLDEYYDYRGWDSNTGFQTRSRLEELGLEDIADVLEKEGVLSLKKPEDKNKVVQESRKKAQAFKAKLAEKQ